MNGLLARMGLVAVAATVVGGVLWNVFASGEDGTLHVRRGEIRLEDGDYQGALASFNEALARDPVHHGALMGRALVYIQIENYQRAVEELSRLISILRADGEAGGDSGEGDSMAETDRALLAVAYANRGNVHDREGRYEEAFADYVRALRIDEEVVSGPDLIDRVLYGTPNPSTVRNRAIYLKEQLALPENQRLLRVPELDSRQRMHKP